MDWKTFRQERTKNGGVLVVAHRGVPVLEPENTLSSFALALEQGADVLETDLRFTRDDEIVLIHDATLERTTNGQGKVRDHTLAALKQFRTRNPGSDELSEQAVPSLGELLMMTRSEVPVLLELKDPLFRERPYAEKLVQTLAEYHMLDKSAIVASKAERMQAVQAVHPAIPTGRIIFNNPLPPGGIVLLGPFWPLLFVNPLYVSWAHRKGSIVAPLDPNPVPRLSFYLRLGVDALLANHPREVIEAMEQHQRTGKK
jgi:glycerophosphoryl diester phosphodiesterase